MMKRVSQWTLERFAAWDEFWFGADPFAQLRVFRVVLGVVLLGYYGLRTFDLDLLYTDWGVLPLESFRAAMESKYSFSLFFLSSNRELVWGAHIVLLIATLALIFGFRPRLAAIIVYLLHLSFDQRNPLVAYGFNKVTVFFLITLILASYHPQQAPLGSLRRCLASIALRFAQIELCIIYLFSGTEKLKGLTWWRGEALWGVLSNSQTTSFDFTLAAQFPLVLTLLTFATLIWEIYFPALVWVKGTRYLWLLGGVCMHAGIGITMNIPFFAAVMVVAYSVFLDKKDAERLEQFFWGRVKGFRERLQGIRFFGSTGIEASNPTAVSE